MYARDFTGLVALGSTVLSSEIWAFGLELYKERGQHIGLHLQRNIRRTTSFWFASCGANAVVSTSLVEACSDRLAFEGCLDKGLATEGRFGVEGVWNVTAMGTGARTFARDLALGRIVDILGEEDAFLDRLGRAEEDGFVTDVCEAD